jgi:hypothetical protein
MIDRRQLTIVLAILLLTLVAGTAIVFVGRDPGDAEPAQVAAPETTTAPTSTTEPPPELENTGEDFNRIWQSINAYYVWLGRNPEPELLDEIFNRRCECYQPNLERLQLLDKRGWRYKDDGIQVVSVKVGRRSSPSRVLLEVIDRQGPQIIVDRSGKVVRRGVGWVPTRRAMILDLSEDRHWRIIGTTQFGPT